MSHVIESFFYAQTCALAASRLPGACVVLPIADAAPLMVPGSGGWIFKWLLGFINQYFVGMHFKQQHLSDHGPNLRDCP
eukprot:5498856-Amphidinium_carterae.1